MIGKMSFHMTAENSQRWCNTVCSRHWQQKIGKLSHRHL